MGQEEEEDNHAQNPPKPTCDFCSAAPPVIFCRADSARLCLSCDRQVHAANTVSSRHSRSILCDTCRSSASTFFCSSPSCNSFLCSNCDFDLHGNGEIGFEHGRRGVEGYVGCPTGAELAGVLGVRIDEKGGEELGVRVLETEKVFRLEDLIVPTTACHGFHPLQTTPLPKQNWDSYCGKYKDEILHQLQELIKSETCTDNSNEVIEPISNLFSWDSNYSQFQGNYNPDTTFDSTSVMVPANEEMKWNLYDSYTNNNNFQNMDISYDPYLVTTPDETNMVNFLEMSEICPSESNYENNIKHGEFKEMIHLLPVKNGPDFVCPDRGSVLSRYKEKRKTRRYDKLVRYESRKVRADGRLRIKGRFAKGQQGNKS